MGAHDAGRKSIMAELSVDQQKAVAMASARQRASESSQSANEPQLNAVERGAADRMLGVEELTNNLGIGKHIGLPSNEILEGAEGISKEQGQNARKGAGLTSRVGSTAGELVGDPMSWFGGAELKGASGAMDLAKVGAKYGGLSGLTETGAKNIGGNLKNAAIGGVTGGVTGGILTPAILGGVKTIGGTAKLLGEGFGARRSEALANDLAKLRDESHGSYKTMRDENAGVTPQAVKDMQVKVGEELNKTGLFNPQLHKNTLSVLKQLNKASENGISLESLDQHRQLLSEVVNSNTVNGKMNSDAMKASKAIRAIDDAVDNLKPEHLTTQSTKAIQALKDARASWAKSRKFETVVDLLEKSGNDPNRRKQLLEQLSNNKKLTKGWSKEELAALKDATRNNTFEGLAKMAGKFGINLGGGRAAATGNVIPAFELLAQGARKGIPVVAAGTGAKYMQNLAGKAKAERLLKTIEGSAKPVLPNTGTPLGAVIPQIQNSQKQLP